MTKTIDQRLTYRRTKHGTDVDLDGNLFAIIDRETNGFVVVAFVPQPGWQISTVWMPATRQNNLMCEAYKVTRRIEEYASVYATLKERQPSF